MWNVCQQCGRSMDWQKQKWCSDACKMKAYRRRKDSLVGSDQRHGERIRKAVETKKNTLIEVECAVCHTHFNVEATRNNTIYCSNACSQKAYRQRQKATSSASTTTPAQAVIDPASAAAGIHDQPHFQFQIGDDARVINLKSPELNRVGWVSRVEGDQVGLLFEISASAEPITFSASELAIADWSCDAGPRGIQGLINRISVAYRRRYGHSWMFEGCNVMAKRDGYWIEADGETRFLNSHAHAKHFLTNYYERGVGNWSLVRQGTPKPNDMSGS